MPPTVSQSRQHDPVPGISSTHRRRETLPLTGVVLTVVFSPTLWAAQSEGQVALQEFLAWKSVPAHSTLQFGEAVRRYREKLKAEASDAVADRTIRIILAHYEGEGYNQLYAAPPEFNTEPNQLLVEAVDGRPPGTALDVGMGQGRNAVYLAGKGWTVTGFDVAEVGLAEARRHAAARGLNVTTVHASDEEFDFGRERWDLIAIIFALEKRSVFRVRDALKPGGLVVIEAAHTDTSPAPFHYDANELLEIFKGFRILRYEDRSGRYDWGPETIRLVRLVAQKPS
jgi:2-polyprenyl-3-methyl-5-hydroxy-6-metoxy-1,4-benzoquinol methylase